MSARKPTAKKPKKTAEPAKKYAPRGQRGGVAIAGDVACTDFLGRDKVTTTLERASRTMTALGAGC